MSQPFVPAGEAYTQHIFLEGSYGAALILGEGQAIDWFLPRDVDTLLMSVHARAAMEALNKWLTGAIGHPDQKA